jgi:quercetin dioxygenase-like cupin family protein
MSPLTAFAQATRRRTGASSTVVHGAGLIIETLVELPAGKVPSRVSTDDTLIRVIDGIVCLSTDDGDRLMGPGDEAIVPAYAEHRLASAGGDAKLISGSRAAR